MLLTVLALATAATAPTILEKDPDEIVCRSKIDRRTKMRTDKVCKTRAEWEGKYEDADAAADAAAVAERKDDERVASNPK